LPLPTENFDTESELLLRISQGDPHAFRQMFAVYSRQVYSLCIQLTKDAEQAKDLTQEIFARLWVKRGQLGSVYHFKGFLTTMALNLVRNHLQKKVLDVSNDAYLLAYFEESAPAAGHGVGIERAARDTAGGGGPSSPAAEPVVCP
jgi:DNA-directed RNA polymerase specialized sigma24 family protein